MNLGSILTIGNFNYCNPTINTENVDVNSVTIVFNFSDENVQRFIPFENLRDYASRVIYNFPNAKNIKIENVDIFGSIIAPNADVEIINGELRGQVISESLKMTWVNMNDLVIFNGDIKNNDSQSISLGNIVNGDESTQSEDDGEIVQNVIQTNDQNNVPNVVTDSVPITIPGTGTGGNPNCKVDEFPLGIVSNFGAFSFNSFIASSSDVQGRIAAKNVVDVSQYSINEILYGGKRYRCDEDPLNRDFPYAVVAGTVKINDAGLYNGGIAYTDNVNGVSNDIKSSIINNGCQISKIPNLIDFDEVERNMNKISEDLATLPSTGSVSLLIYFYK